MAYADDFMEGGPQQSAAPEYPSAFGIQFTPPVIGIIAGVIGLGAAVYAFTSLVQPVMQQNDTLKTQIQEEEAKVTQPEVIEQRLQQAKLERTQAAQQKNAVLALFANEPNLKTLLLDLNKRIENRNTGLNPDEIRARLKKFDPDPKASGPITDASFGAAVTNQLYREVYNVELEGTFAQTMLFMLDLERLKPLLVVKNLKSELDATDRFYVYPQQGKLVPVKVKDPSGGQAIVKTDPQGNPVKNPTRLIKTSFVLQALRPLTVEEKAKLASPPAAPGTTTPGATPSPAASPTPAK